MVMHDVLFFFFSSRRRHTRLQGDWSSDVCSSDLDIMADPLDPRTQGYSVSPYPPELQGEAAALHRRRALADIDRKSTRLNSSHLVISYAVFCLKKKKDAEAACILQAT